MKNFLTLLCVAIFAFIAAVAQKDNLQATPDSIVAADSISVNTQPANNDLIHYAHPSFHAYPEFPGGEEALYAFLKQNTRYPKEALEYGKNCRVIVEFDITEEGNIENIHVAASRHPALDREALRVVGLMPKWKPAKISGKAVRCIYHIPVAFCYPLTPPKDYAK